MATPSQNQIADLAGVSRSTVAWALNPKRRHKLRAETLQRVERAAEQLNYRPHRYAQIMRSGKSGLIGLLRFGGASPMRSELEYHALQGIRAGGFKPIVVGAVQTPADVSAACEELLDARIDGLVIEGPNFSATQNVVERFRRAAVPLVILNGSETPATPHVRSNMRQGMADLTRHLLKLGHQRLTLLIKWLDPEVYRYDWWRNYDKILGFSDALREANGTLRDTDGHLDELTRLNREVTSFQGSSAATGTVVGEVGERNWFDPFHEGLLAAEKLLQRGSPAGVLVCTNDDWAIGAMTACQRAGIQVPRDLAITGFDNDAVGKYLPVPLTTVTQPTAENAATAIKLLFEMLQGQTPPTETIKLPTQLIVRESCGTKLLRP